MGKPTIWFPNKSDTNRSVQAQKRARSLKFRIKVEEELYYLISENKGADQLRRYCEADLRLCFRLGRLLVFPCGGSYMENIMFFQLKIFTDHQIFLLVYFSFSRQTFHPSEIHLPLSETPKIRIKLA